MSQKFSKIAIINCIICDCIFWQPTPAILPGESHGQRSLVGCSLQGCTELGTTKVT